MERRTNIRQAPSASTHLSTLATVAAAAEDYSTVVGCDVTDSLV